VRLLHNKFYEQVHEAEQNCMNKEDLIKLLGKARSKKGMYEGNLDDGELEAGQVSGHINDIKSASEVLQDIWQEFRKTTEGLGRIKF
jgi:enoyl-[acyl-carrier protein] reductase II